jgi:hypothetical protein
VLDDTSIPSGERWSASPTACEAPRGPAARGRSARCCSW